VASSEKAKNRKQPPSVANRELLVATSHPTRVKALAILREGDASPGEIGRQINRSSKHVKYHLDQLRKVDLVEIVDERSSYGGRVKEKIYRGKHRPYMDQQGWREATEEEQLAITGKAIGLVSEDVTEAMLGQTINFPDNSLPELDPNHISRTTLALDRQGWNELVDLLKETLDRAITINDQAAERGMERETDLIPARLAILQFKSPSVA
jgi:DNA-binding transcriptional ArsR family regulator